MEKTICWADTETKSECCLKTHGTARYAEHPSTDVQLFSYGFGDGPIEVWSKEDGQPMPKDLKDAFRDPSVLFYFHNAYFDRNIIRSCIRVDLPIQRYRCSMAQSLSHGLPGSLEKLGEVLGIREDAQKVKDGKRLVQKFCKPKRLKDGTLKWATPLTDPEDWAKYIEYCRTDTAAMREIVKKIPKWNYPYNEFELNLWFADQERNDRGLLIDLDLVEKMMDAVEKEQKVLAKATKGMTDGEVESATQRDAMLKFILDEFGVELPDMRKATLERLVECEDTDEALRALLEVRLSTCTTSTAKYKRLRNVTSVDGRARGTIQFAGASRTARDAGRNIQCQNFPSRGLMPTEEIKDGIEAVKAGYYDILGLDVMWLATSALRYTIYAGEGKKLVVSDLSNIEGRVLAWLAGEQWKLDAFAAFDAGTGFDIYILAVAKAFGIKPETVTKQQRNAVGKILELSLGYAGGCGAIITFATAFGLDLHEFANTVRPTVPAKILADAESFYHWLDGKEREEAKKKSEQEYGTTEQWAEFYTGAATYKLPVETYAPLESLKRLWRAAHPKTVEFWAEAEGACRYAVEVSNQRFYFGKCYAFRKGKWVGVVLPSGHVIPYPGMAINKKGDLTYKGVDQFSKKWTTITTHGGKLAENCWAFDTRVLTKNGAKAIIDVTKDDLVWDGTAWVNTDGCVYNGVCKVGSWYGTSVTEDHLLYTGSRFKKVSKLSNEQRGDVIAHGRIFWPWETFRHPHRIYKLRPTQDKVWTPLEEPEKVYDLLNCGPKSRYTVITDAGPVIVHNCTQALARDVFKFGELAALDAGYDVVMPLHDELVTEVPDTERYSVQELGAIMSTNPPWAEGLPLTADGHEDYRYHKKD